ncbi:MAG: hypothetical protein ACLFWB_01260 [Armatimonadota bacterium]
MLEKPLSGKDLLILSMLAFGIGLYAVSVVVSGSVLPQTSPAHAQDIQQPLEVTSAANVIGDRDVGEVMVADNVVLRIRTAAGGFSAADRADIVADRLRDMLLSGLQPSEIHAGMMRGQTAVLAGDRLIVTADQEHANLNQTTPTTLAQEWAANLAGALGGEPGAPEIEEEAASAPAEWQPSEPYDDKDVPIISVGRGVRVGMARVSGPTSKVEQVEGVAQIESNLSDFGDVEIYVPISTKVPGESLDRINECAVVGLADLKL